MSDLVRALALGCALLSFGALAQDPVAVDPSHHKVEFENAQIRVLRISFAPGDKSVMHSHPCYVAIGLDDSELLIHMPDGKERVAKLTKGQVVSGKPWTHLPENVSSKPVEVILVEMKQGRC
ncbi:MAG TPA: hypothetical protein VFB54_12690 [Burkholderiales bacterium]|nr:hypothetical protein [Burkholderiales bacterium]